jgi:hypothetical protein
MPKNMKPAANIHPATAFSWSTWDAFMQFLLATVLITDR